MIDFNDLTQEQREFFTSLWQKNQQQAEQASDSEKSFNTYIEQRRRHEAEQTKAAEALKKRLV